MSSVLNTLQKLAPSSIGLHIFFRESAVVFFFPLENFLPNCWPNLQGRVTLGDIEPCLCGAFIYAKQVEQLRGSLPSERSRWTWSDECWKKIEDLPVSPAKILAIFPGRAVNVEVNLFVYICVYIHLYV